MAVGQVTPMPSSEPTRIVVPSKRLSLPVNIGPTSTDRPIEEIQPTTNMRAASTDKPVEEKKHSKGGAYECFLLLRNIILILYFTTKINEKCRCYNIYFRC